MIDYTTFFKDKDVVLVGNCVEIMNHDYAEFIDSHDIVVRFGKGIEANEKEQRSVGKKLDVWVTGDFRSKMVNIEPYKTMLADVPILYNRARIHVARTIDCKKIPEVEHSLDMFSDKEILDINASIGVKDGDPDSRRLSAGMWTIMFFCEKVKNYKSLTLIGFDFFKKPTSSMRQGSAYMPYSWHRPISTGKRETHWHEQEVSIVERLQSEGKLKWIILSDLKDEVIHTTKNGRF